MTSYTLQEQQNTSLEQFIFSEKNELPPVRFEPTHCKSNTHTYTSMPACTHHHYISHQLCIISSQIAQVVILNYHLVFLHQSWGRERREATGGRRGKRRWEEEEEEEERHIQPVMEAKHSLLISKIKNRSSGNATST